MSRTAALPSDVPPRTLKASSATHLLHVGSSSGRPDRSRGLYPLWVGVTMSIHISSDSTSVTVAVKTSVTPCWLLGGAALSVGAPLLPTQGSLRRSLVDGLRPPLTREPLRRPWAGWGQERACPMCRAAPEDGFAAPAAAGRGCGRGGEAAAGPGSAGCGPV